MPFDSAPINTTAQTLRDAAAYIEEHGWCQRTFKNAEGQVCITRAMMMVQQSDEPFWRASRALDKHLGEHKIDFNDTPGRTKEEVLAALHGAADMEEANAL